jgi:hypothetical protein
MKKKLSERIAERAKSKQQSRNAKNRAQFLNVRDEIQEALDEKWTIKDIWETLHIEGAITFSYEAFRNHVNAWQNPSKPPTKENRKAQTNKDDDKKKIPPKPNLKNRLSYQVLNTIQYPTKRNSTNVKNTHHFAR